MRGIIQATNKSQSGKTIGVQIEGKWYSSKNWELVDNVGKTIIFEPSTSTFNGQEMHWLNDYVFDDYQTASQPMSQAMSSQHIPADGRGDQGTAQPSQPVNTPPNKDALISALALTKAISGSKEQVWEGFVYFYNKLLVWDHRAPF